ncbi:MAG: hypothetical protein AAB505_02670 [Patescibacteria group bacterium]
MAQSEDEADEIVANHLTGDVSVDRAVAARLHLLDLLKDHS